MGDILGTIERRSPGIALTRVAGRCYGNFVIFLLGSCVACGRARPSGSAIVGCLGYLGTTFGVTVRRRVVSSGPMLHLHVSILGNNNAGQRCLAISRIGELVSAPYGHRSVGTTFLFSYFYKLHVDSIGDLG